MLIKNRNEFSKRILHNINVTIDLLQEINVFNIKGPLGTIKFGCNNKELYFREDGQFFSKYKKYTVFLNNFRDALRGVCIPWLRRFVITGYHYKIAFSPKRQQLAIDLGFTYWLIINLTTDNLIRLRMIPNKLLRTISRKFLLTSIDYTTFKKLIKYFNTVRSLLPYNIKGLTFPRHNIKVKVGKKITYR